jgi:hypothetical protein
MKSPSITLTVLPESLAVSQLSALMDIPQWAIASPFFSMTRTADELSIVSVESVVPSDVRCERGWRALRFEGPFDFALTGILVAVANPLAIAQISIFAISTYDTDYILLRESQLEEAIAVLTTHGHWVQKSGASQTPH